MPRCATPPHAAILLALTLVALAPSAGSAELSGRVFVDGDADGHFGPGDTPAPEVRVSNGLAVVATDGEGRFQLPEGPDGFVFITRPADLHCAAWYQRGSGDFACTPRSRDDGFFFAQVSDLHVYEEPADFAHYSRFLPSWVPEAIQLRVTQLVMDRLNAATSRAQRTEGLREAVAASAGTAAPDLAGASDLEVLAAWNAEYMRAGSPAGQVAAAARAALAEVAALGPRFVVNTGDLILEGNAADGEAAERWMDFYQRAVGETGLVFHETIGNNELVGSSNGEVSPDDPRYGRGLFQQRFGPSYYSFDHGPYHFVALDSHAVIGKSFFGRRPKWSFHTLRDDVLHWLEADLAAHPGRVHVLLNHEPLVPDPAQGFLDPIDDRGLLETHRVRYALAGHSHQNGYARAGNVDHVTTGALSGMRWALPASVHERGFRLFYAEGGQLYSAWKRTGAPCVGFVHPGGDAALHATGPANEEGPGAGSAHQAELVAVAADRAGPFASVALRADGVPLEHRRMGEYFLTAFVGDAEAVELTAHRSDGSSVRATLELRGR